MPLGKHASKQQIFLNSALKKNPYSDTKRATQKAWSKIPPISQQTQASLISSVQACTSQPECENHTLLMETGLALVHPLLCPPCWKPGSDFQSFYVCRLLDTQMLPEPQGEWTV